MLEVQVPSELARLVQRPKAILPVQIEKTVIIAFITKELKIKRDFTLEWLHFARAGHHIAMTVVFKKALLNIL